MSLQECLAKRKDCSGDSEALPLSKVNEICHSVNQVDPSRKLFILLPEGPDYTSGAYIYENGKLNFLSDDVKTKHTMELYPELISKEKIDNSELVRVGLTWQYLSLKVGSLGLGVSQRARTPKSFNKLVNKITSQENIFLYSIAVRNRDRDILLEDRLEPLQIKLNNTTHLLETPECYKNRLLYKNKYDGISLDDAIFKRIQNKSPDNSSLYELSQLLWACQGEVDHATHGNRDPLEKNGYGRVHASGCAGHSVYPVVLVEQLAGVSKGAYVYNPIGLSGLHRWININNDIVYDHCIHKYSTNNILNTIRNTLNLSISDYAILLCIDKKKPCSGFMHSKILDVKYWSEIEAGMSLAGLQLQANALGLKWNRHIFSALDDPVYREKLELETAENCINKTALNIINKPKNDKFSLKGTLVPLLLFYLD